MQPCFDLNATLARLLLKLTHVAMLQSSQFLSCGLYILYLTCCASTSAVVLGFSKQLSEQHLTLGHLAKWPLTALFPPPQQ